ncbi:MAG: 4Fe-4S dicluster domain-containing protein [Lachnospiraceae bacterium]|nr:4Fe-4S dicluster domain-containing protein [Lachnospiraceae bacterium]
MRGITTTINEIRQQVFAEIAALSYEYDKNDKDFFKKMEHIPYRVVPGEESTHSDSVFLERAIVAERMRLAMGLPVRKASEQLPVSDGAQECIIPEKYYEPPLVNIIKFACHKCPDNVVHVTDTCQGCLSRSCHVVCPKDAISFKDGKSVIDQEKCIKCGKCIEACPYGAIVRQERPCAKACGAGAIGSDEYGRADINYERCVSCGMCLANCPFGAIADKAQIFQVIQAIKEGTHVYAAMAPAITGQFGAKCTPEKIRSAMKALGFRDAVEVAIGADLCTLQEAEDFVNEVPDKLPWMGTSCCPAWSVFAKQTLPDRANCISMALTPMVLTGRLLKKQHPGCKVVFIGPCVAKKLEASRKSIRSDVDFVLTFEEVLGMFKAKNVDFDKLEETDCMHGASGDGRAFAVSGGVAEAVVNVIKEKYPEYGDVKVQTANGLAECKKMLIMAKAGKYDGYLLEGMACPGGCVAGAGTVQPIAKSANAIKIHKDVSTNKHAYESNYKDVLSELED